jgi:hypothetical protein
MPPVSYVIVHEAGPVNFCQVPDNLAHFTTKLAQLPGGVTLDVSRDECDRLFTPGLHTAQGRNKMYTLANSQLCDIRWGNDGSLHFIKRRVHDALAQFSNAMRWKL